MKLGELYTSILNEVSFETFEDEDRVDILAMEGRTNFGKIIIEFVSGGYWMFEDEMDEDDYYDLFPDDRFAKIEHLEVNDEHRGKGYAKLLVNKAIEFIKSRGENIIYLNASPMGFGGLNINDLVSFYESFGFEIIPQTAHWDKNKEMILKVN